MGGHEFGRAFGVSELRGCTAWIQLRGVRNAKRRGSIVMTPPRAHHAVRANVGRRPGGASR